MPPNLPSPQRIMGTATQYWPSALLLNAIKLDVFSLIPEEGATAEELARKGGFAPRHLALLLNALTAHEFLDKRDARFFNAPDTEAYLKRGSPAYLGRALAFAQDLYDPWGRLHLTVREGVPAAPEPRHLGAGQDETRHFVRAMHERALALGPALTAEFDLSGAGTLLDLGGGPGTLSLQLTRKYPGLRGAVVLDLPPVAIQAAALLKEQGAGEEVRTVGGSYLEPLAPQVGAGRFDAVLLSGQMHQERLEDCVRILENASQVLRPGGKLYLVDIMVEEGKSSPRFATLFGINMSLMRTHGGVHSRIEMEESLRGAGFRILKQGAVALDYPYWFFLAEKWSDPEDFFGSRMKFRASHR